MVLWIARRQRARGSTYDRILEAIASEIVRRPTLGEARLAYSVDQHTCTRHFMEIDVEDVPELQIYLRIGGGKTKTST